MTVDQLKHPQRRTTPDYTHHSLNGTEMKNMGISSRLLLLVWLAGMWIWNGASAARPGRSQEDTGAPAHDHPERGDVPGWVMITLMSAVLVAALLALAGPALEAMFNQAMDKVGS
jgi:hypothetical protein